jgi:hypothetical protein
VAVPGLPFGPWRSRHTYRALKCLSGTVARSTATSETGWRLALLGQAWSQSALSQEGQELWPSSWPLMTASAASLSSAEVKQVPFRWGGGAQVWLPIRRTGSLTVLLPRGFGVASVALWCMDWRPPDCLLGGLLGGHRPVGLGCDDGGSLA